MWNIKNTFLKQTAISLRTKIRTECYRTKEGALTDTLLEYLAKFIMLPKKSVLDWATQRAIETLNNNKDTMTMATLNAIDRNRKNVYVDALLTRNYRYNFGYYTLPKLPRAQDADEAVIKTTSREAFRDRCAQTKRDGITVYNAYNVQYAMPYIVEMLIEQNWVSLPCIGLLQHANHKLYILRKERLNNYTTNPANTTTTQPPEEAVFTLPKYDYIVLTNYGNVPLFSEITKIVMNDERVLGENTATLTANMDLLADNIPEMDEWEKEILSDCVDAWNKAENSAKKVALNNIVKSIPNMTRKRLSDNVQLCFNEFSQLEQNALLAMHIWKEAQSKLYGYDAGLTNQQDNDEALKQVLATNADKIKNITLNSLNTTNASMNIVIETPLTYWEPKEYVTLKNSPRKNAVNSISKTKLWDALFLHKTAKLYLSELIQVALSVDEGQRAVNFDSAGDAHSTLPNPHHSFYNCWGDYRTPITKMIKENNWGAVIELLITAVAGINFQDSAVIDRFFRQLEQTHGTTCIEVNGVRMSMDAAKQYFDTLPEEPTTDETAATELERRKEERRKARELRLQMQQQETELNTPIIEAIE